MIWSVPLNTFWVCPLAVRFGTARHRGVQVCFGFVSLRRMNGSVTNGFHLVGARGFEPLTSSVSRKRSPPELSARSTPL